jgi:hypothetical protein
MFAEDIRAKNKNLLKKVIPKALMNVKIYSDTIQTISLSNR